MIEKVWKSRLFYSTRKTITVGPVPSSIHTPAQSSPHWLWLVHVTSAGHQPISKNDAGLVSTYMVGLVLLECKKRFWIIWETKIIGDKTDCWTTDICAHLEQRFRQMAVSGWISDKYIKNQWIFFKKILLIILKQLCKKEKLIILHFF